MFERDDWRRDRDFWRYAGPGGRHELDAAPQAPAADPIRPAPVPGTDPRMRDDPNQDYDQLDRWLQEHVWDRGWTADGATGDIIDPETGELKGRMPTFYRRI
jgi:hypothetical protein